MVGVSAGTCELDDGTLVPSWFTHDTNIWMCKCLRHSRARTDGIRLESKIPQALDKNHNNLCEFFFLCFIVFLKWLLAPMLE